LATFALTIAGSFVLLPAQSRRYWLDGVFWKPHWIGNVAYVGNQSMRGALTRLLGAEPSALPYWVVAAALVGSAGLTLAAWAAPRGNEMLAVVTCALVGLLISPVSWSHHWVWIAPALVLAADMATRMRTRRWVGWVLVS